MSLRESADYAPATVPNHWEECGQSILTEINVKGVMRELPVDLDISDVKEAFKSRAPELETERTADRTMGAVTADQVFRLDRLRVAVGCGVGDDAVAVRFEPVHLREPSYIATDGLQILIDYPLVDALLDN